MSEPPKRKRVPPGQAPFCECGCGQQVEYNWRGGKWRRWVMGHSPKSSVTEIQEFYSPVRILELCRKAYDEPNINDAERVEHSALPAALYLGAFRIGEGLSLTKYQFKRMRSLEDFEFMVIEAVVIEKSEGKMRNCPLYVKDPLAVPLFARLAELQDSDKVFTFTDRTGNNIADRISNGVAWNHWFRAQRDTFLAQVFTGDERKKIIGWGAGTREQRMKRRNMADRYEFLNWMSYADRLAKLSDRYWEHTQIDSETKLWLEMLKEKICEVQQNFT